MDILDALIDDLSTSDTIGDIVIADRKITDTWDDMDEDWLRT